MDTGGRADNKTGEEKTGKAGRSSENRKMKINACGR